MGSFEQDDGSLQRRALLAYLTLSRVVPDWARRLVMLSASDRAAPFALAALAASGAVLWTDADETSLRAAGMSGLVDFQVSTLSEALRILKNEIRKGLPVSVGVLDASGTVWREAVERGVQPQALLATAREREAAEVLLQRGASPLDLAGDWAVIEHEAKSWRERRSADEALLVAAGGLQTPLRDAALKWLRAAPRLFPRDLFRCYPALPDASKDDR